jgi:hypothetical protein
VVLLMAGIILFGIKDFGVIASMADRQANWYPYIIHDRANYIIERVPAKKVLTLSPLLAVEARRELYPQFVTGPLAFRVADLLPVAERAKFNMVGPAELDAFLASNPPSLILVGLEDEDRYLAEYAQKNNYASQEISAELKIWVK